MKKETGRRADPRRTGQKEILGEREKRRLIQLGLCLLLFLTVFLSKGADRLSGLRAELAQALRTDGDFQAVTAVLSGSVTSREPLGQTLGKLWMGLFLPRERTVSLAARRDERLYQVGRTCLKEGLFPSVAHEAPPEERKEDAVPPAESAPPQTPPPQPTPEPEVEDMGYTGPALPENTTMDKYNLHLDETVTPVLSHVTSGFGWREDPLGGGGKFHNGLDLAAAEGTPVLAFAAGTVDYIGESDAYGQYLQLDHGNGVKSFYAHCSKLCVQKGQTVAAGEKVAESGATGDVTGPHLHLELKKDGTRLNPTYYIDFES